MQEEFTDSAALSYYQKRIRVGRKLSLILRAYFLMGLLLAVGGAGFVAYSKLKITLAPDEQAALAVAFMGVIMAIASYGYLSYRQAIYERDLQEFTQHRAVGRFIEAWVRFEEASKNVAFSSGDEPERTNLREILAQLRRQGKFTTADVIEAEDLLQLRNALVHGLRSYPAEDLDAALAKLLNLLTKVS